MTLVLSPAAQHLVTALNRLAGSRAAVTLSGGLSAFPPDGSFRTFPLSANRGSGTRPNPGKPAEKPIRSQIGVDPRNHLTKYSVIWHPEHNAPTQNQEVRD